MNPGSFALAEDDNPRHQRTTLLPVILKPAQTAEEPIFSLRTRWILDPSLSLRMTSRTTIEPRFTPVILKPAQTAEEPIFALRTL